MHEVLRRCVELARTPRCCQRRHGFSGALVSTPSRQGCRAAANWMCSPHSLTPLPHPPWPHMLVRRCIFQANRRRKGCGGDWWGGQVPFGVPQVLSRPFCRGAPCACFPLVYLPAVTVTTWLFTCHYHRHSPHNPSVPPPPSPNSFHLPFLRLSSPFGRLPYSTSTSASHLPLSYPNSTAHAV